MNYFGIVMPLAIRVGAVVMDDIRHPEITIKKRTVEWPNRLFYGLLFC